VARLDEEKIGTLRQWAEGLARDERDEMRAAARAILLLIEEVEGLHVDLWHARELHADEEGVEDAARPGLASVLKGRLRNVRDQGTATE
jgi:streptomycin 6-kinase